MKRKTSAIIILILFQIIAYSQSFYIQLDQSQGVSSFIPSHGHYKIKYAYQYGVSTGVNITESIGANIGLAYQLNGAAGYISEINSSISTETVRQNLDASFLKIPVNINIRFKNIFVIGIGAYYNMNLTASFRTDSPFGTIASPIRLEELAQNDYGLHFNPSILIPLDENFILQLGILQEFGMKVIWNDVVNYSTSAKISLRYLLQNS